MLKDLRIQAVARCLAFAALAGLLVMLVGCAGGTTSIYVHNDTQQTWYLKVRHTHTDDPDYDYQVVSVLPGANGFALSWFGGRDVPVSVLTPDCDEVGVFQPGTDDQYVVGGVAGLTARVEDHGGPIGSTPGIDYMSACGGFMGV